MLSLESGDGALAQSVRFPAGRPAGGHSAATFGLELRVEACSVERVRTFVRTRRLAYVTGHLAALSLIDRLPTRVEAAT